MGFLDRLRGRETRSTTALAIKASDPFLGEYFGLSRAGRAIASPDEAVACLAVAARCVSLIAEGLAALPLRVYRWDQDGGRVLAPTHSLDVLLNDVANPGASAFTVREALVADVLTHGNGYLRQEIDGRGRVAALYYVPRAWVGVERLSSGRLRYRVADPIRGTQVYTADEIIHLRYRSRDGVMGVSPLGWAGSAVGLAVAQADLAQSQTARGFCPDLAFSTEAQFPGDDKGDSAFKRLKDQLSERLGKMGDRPTALLLEAGLKAQQLAPSGREAQFHETRQAGLADIARIYGVPSAVLGLGAQASYGSLTEESRALVQNCFRPWARRIESELMRTALTADGRRNFTIEHDMAGSSPATCRSALPSTAPPSRTRSSRRTSAGSGGPEQAARRGRGYHATTGTGDRTGSSPPGSRESQASAQPAEA